MPIDTGYPIGPVIAVVVMVLLVLFTRWAFGTGYGRSRGHSRGRSRRRPAGPADDGLLVCIATLSRRESALALRAVLSDAGIRSTIRTPLPRRADVLVFPEDADRARTLAASFPGPA